VQIFIFKIILIKTLLNLNSASPVIITLKKNKAYLFIRNIQTKRPSKKLNYKKIKSFKIKKSIKNISFELNLSKIIKIYLIFYISFFKLADARAPIAKILKNNIKEFLIYNVEIILNK
jgi:hypothetical protein